MKQLYIRFVLPPLIISVLLWICCIYGSDSGLSSILITVLSATVIFILIRTTQYIHKLQKNLFSLENGSYTGNELSDTGISGELKSLLTNISQRILKQESELQLEKIRRLRSVVDGQDQERNRLSRELHDGIGQSLIAIKLQLESAETRNYSMMRAGIDSAKNMIDITIEEVRRVCNALLPAALNEFGIVSTLRALFSELSSLAGFKAVFESTGSLDRMSKKSQIYIYRIAQEALNNIAKHARATEVVLNLSRENNIVTLQVSDNGKGFIFDPVSFAQRNGLQNMRERTQLLLGEFTIKSQPGNGTTIIVSIPFTTENGKDQADLGG